LETPPDQLESLIDRAWESRQGLNPENAGQDLVLAIESCLDGLEAGAWRVAEPTSKGWQVRQWLKKAVLLSFRIRENRVMEGGFTRFYDKVPLRWGGEDSVCAGEELAATGARIVPPATVRRGAHIASDAVLMPCYVNIGAYVGSGTMIDTWATVGSCAQVGENVHISGGVGIGGVLEPLQAAPTIIEDDCFIGARSEIVEGVTVERGSVISMGVFIGQSTRIYDRRSGEITRGRVPAGSVVVPGSLPAEDGSHSLYCAVIVKQVDEKTRARTSVNELLRDAG
jgi:2,3,4,5-tetrahydropyridine-2-carboxylate N-succinyltransferase